MIRGRFYPYFNGKLTIFVSFYIFTYFQKLWIKLEFFGQMMKLIY